MTAFVGEDEVGVGQGAGVCVGGYDAAAGGFEAVDVVFIVSDEDDVLGVELVFLAPGLKAFVFAALKFVKAFEF